MPPIYDCLGLGRPWVCRRLWRLWAVFGVMLTLVSRLMRLRFSAACCLSCFWRLVFLRVLFIRCRVRVTCLCC